jgi:uncharacterized membrane protein
MSQDSTDLPPRIGRHPLLGMLLDGLMVILPIGAVVLVILAIVHHLRDATEPLAGRFIHPMVMGAALFVVLCFVIGLAVRSAAGRVVRRGLEATVFERIPGYRLARAFTSNGPTAQGGRPMRPALVSIEEGLCPALVVDEFSDGQLLIFVPGSPAPMSGAIYIFTPDRVTLLDVPLLPFLQSISAWGLGLQELLGKPPVQPHLAREAGPAENSGPPA